MQAVKVLRWFRDGTGIAAHAPDLHEVLAHGVTLGWEFTRTGERSEAGHDLWHSGKHHRHGGNIQVLADPTGFPVWVSGGAPGSVHDITVARGQGILGALYAAAGKGLPTLADKGYVGSRPRAQTPAGPSARFTATGAWVAQSRDKPRPPLKSVFHCMTYRVPTSVHMC